MRVTFFDGPMSTSPVLRKRATERVNAALARFGDAVRSVEVRIADENAAKGGVDKRCRLLAHVVGHEPVLIDQRHADYYAAIDAAVDRLKAAVGRRLRR